MELAEPALFDAEHPALRLAGRGDRARLRDAAGLRSPRRDAAAARGARRARRADDRERIRAARRRDPRARTRATGSRACGSASARRGELYRTWRTCATGECERAPSAACRSSSKPSPRPRPARGSAPAAGRCGSAISTSPRASTSRGRSSSSRLAVAALVEDVRGEHEVPGAALDDRAAARPGALERLDLHVVAAGVARPWRARRRATSPWRGRARRSARRRCSAARARSRARASRLPRSERSDRSCASATRARPELGPVGQELLVLERLLLRAAPRRRAGGPARSRRRGAECARRRRARSCPEANPPQPAEPAASARPGLLRRGLRGPSSRSISSSPLAQKPGSARSTPTIAPSSSGGREPPARSRSR